MASRTEQRPEELHIDDGDFERVRHIWPLLGDGPSDVAWCGATDTSMRDGILYCGEVTPDLCVVCVELVRWS